MARHYHSPSALHERRHSVQLHATSSVVHGQLLLCPEGAIDSSQGLRSRSDRYPWFTAQEIQSHPERVEAF